MQKTSQIYFNANELENPNLKHSTLEIMEKILWKNKDQLHSNLKSWYYFINVPDFVRSLIENYPQGLFDQNEKHLYNQLTIEPIDYLQTPTLPEIGKKILNDFHKACTLRIQKSTNLTNSERSLLNLVEFLEKNIPPVWADKIRTFINKQ